MPDNFADDLIEQIEGKGTCVVVGLDPRLESIPAQLRKDVSIGEDECEAAAQTILAFNRRIIQIVARHACAVKPQIAFYERFGWQGVRAYAETVRIAHEHGLLVIGDVKRGDIGSTAQAYAEAHLDLLDADAVTVNPYLGVDGVRPFIDLAASRAKGVFVLVKTSNPSSADLQDVDTAEGTLYMRVARLVAEWGEDSVGECGYSCVGAVVGATYPGAAAALREAMPHAVFLVPGYGAQGGTAADCKPCFDADGRGAVVNSSRGIIFAHRRQPSETNWENAVEKAVIRMKTELESVRRG